MDSIEPGRPSDYDIELAVEDYLLLQESEDEVAKRVHDQIGKVLMGGVITKHLKAKHPSWTEEDFNKFAEKVVAKWK